MRKSCMNCVLAIIAVIAMGAMVSCENAALGDGDSGALRITLSSGARGLSGSRAIDAAVTTVAVKLSNSLYPPVMAQGAIGSSVTISNVKVGSWKVEVFLNDASGNQLYYGSDNVTIVPNVLTSATLAVFRTGSAQVTIKEGIPSPILSPDAANMTTMTYVLNLVFPSGVTSGSTPRIYYEKGTSAVPPSDPSMGSFNSTNAPSTGVVMSFGDILKARIYVDASNYSAVQTFSYTLPYFSVAQGSYTGYKDVAINSMRSGVTIRYTVSASSPGEEPTYENGIVAGPNAIVRLKYPTSVLRAVSYIAGDPTSVSEIATATYTLNVAPTMQVWVNGAQVSSGGTISYGIVASNSAETTKTVMMFNNGNGQDLVLPPNFRTFTTGTFYRGLEDPSDLDLVIPQSGYTKFTLGFTPGASRGQINDTMSLASNDSASPYTLSLQGIVYDAPTVSFSSGLLVEGAGTTSLNGAYAKISDNTNGYPAYQLNAQTYIWYNSSYNIGTNGIWTSLSNASSDGYSSSNVKYYNWSTSPLGFSGYGTYNVSNGISPAPSVTYLAGIGGHINASSENALSGYMTTSRTLKVYYTATVDILDSAATPLFQWYRSTGSDVWTAISGATTDSYALTSSDIASGTKIRVVLTPRAGSGLVGEQRYTTIIAP